MTAMLTSMMKAKIHNLMVTDKNLHYTGSLGIDSRLLEASGILEFEQIQVVNLMNGERMWTYAIRGEKGSGEAVLNGGMALKGEIGDRLLIITYAWMTSEEASRHRPRVLVVGGDNLHFQVQDA